MTLKRLPHLKKILCLSIVHISILFSFCVAHAITIPWEKIAGVRATPDYSFVQNYAYSIGFYDQTLMVKIDIGMSGYDPGVTLIDRWKTGIESIWSTDRFETPISFFVNWVPIDGRQDQHVRVINDSGRWNMRTWYTTVGAGWGNEYHEEAAAHEFGHMLGLYDEYAGTSFLDPETNRVNTGGLMHTLRGGTLDYYYDDFYSWLDVKTLNWNVSAVPEPASIFLLASGLVGVGAWVRKKKIGDTLVRHPLMAA